MIVADMMAFAMDNPPHSVIVLISGDGDFSYALSLLKRRHYTICVVINNASAPGVLRTAATHVMNWRLDVLKLSVLDDFQEPTADPGLPTVENVFVGDSVPTAVAFRKRSDSVSTTATSTDLENFTELREVLEAFRREGNPNPLWSQVAVRVKGRNPLLYGRSGGPKKFTDYAGAAESKGLVKSGGKSGTEWIQLVITTEQGVTQ
jgi:NYN domain-containing protein